MQVCAQPGITAPTRARPPHFIVVADQLPVSWQRGTMVSCFSSPSHGAHCGIECTKAKRWLAVLPESHVELGLCK